MTALVGLDDPERRQGLVAFGVRVARVTYFPPCAGLLASLDDTELWHPFDLPLTPEGHARLLPFRGHDLVAVIGPREELGGLVGVDLDLARLDLADDRPAGTATFRVLLGGRPATERLVVPVTLAELGQLGAYFGRPARITLGTVEASGAEGRT